MLSHNNIIQKHSDMKGKRQKKRIEEVNTQSQLAKIQQAIPLKIKFNICTDSIACFVGERKNNKKKPHKTFPSIQKRKASTPKVLIPTQANSKLPIAPQKTQRTQCEQIIQGSLNSIVGEIESKGIAYQWKQSDWQSNHPNLETSQLEGNQLFEAFSLDSSLSKSFASTIDVQPVPQTYIQMPNYSHANYYYEYTSYSKSYEDPSLFTVVPQYILNDSRTTVMIRNIPNKYTIRELSEQIDNEFDNTYDFLYLPCDIKNQCNVGYGFINFVSTEYLSKFYQRFHGKRWHRFRSQKICSLTYARLQGLTNLIEHFENSKVQKDKKYRPIIRQFAQIQHLIKSQQLQ